MAMLDVQDRVRAAVHAVPKAWVVISLSIAAWALLIVVGVQAFTLAGQLLR